jgi:hypothetical protein
MPAPRKRERKQRTELVIQDVHSIDELCGYVAGGGTLTEWCRGKDIPYNAINTWLNADKARQERYAAALGLRDSHQKERVTQEVAGLMDADLAEAFDENGCLKSIHDIPLAVRKAIASIEVDELWEGHGKDRRQIGVTRKIKLWDKVKGIELMARKNKMLTDRIEAKHTHTLADLLTDPEPTQ